MHRRALALVLGAAVAMSAAACNNAGPAINDPAEILTKALEAVQNAKSFHFEATVDGTVKLDLTGTGDAGDIALTGTKLAGDIDVDDGDAHVTLEVPAMLGMTAEAILVNDETYVKSSFTGPLFQKGAAGDLGVPVDPSDPKASLDEIRTWLQKPEVDPKKLDDVDCSGKRCYQVAIELTAAELQALSPETEPMTDGAVNLTLLVERESLRFSALKAEMTGSQIGSLSLTLNFTKWDENLSISAPPADQVQG